MRIKDEAWYFTLTTDRQWLAIQVVLLEYVLHLCQKNAQQWSEIRHGGTTQKFFFIAMMFKACSKHPIVIVWAINFHPIIIMLFTCFLVVFGGAKCSHGVSVAPCESESNFFRATPKLCLVSLWLLGPLAILVLVTSKVSDREQQLSYPWQQAQVAFLSDATAFACLFWCTYIAWWNTFGAFNNRLVL